MIVLGHTINVRKLKHERFPHYGYLFCGSELIEIETGNATSRFILYLSTQSAVCFLRRERNPTPNSLLLRKFAVITDVLTYP